MCLSDKDKLINLNECDMTYTFENKPYSMGSYFMDCKGKNDLHKYFYNSKKILKKIIFQFFVK